MPPPVSHRKSTKAGIDLDEARRKREDNIIELRKTARDDSLAKKRQTFATPSDFTLEDSTAKGGGGQRVSAKAVRWLRPPVFFEGVDRRPSSPSPHGELP